MLKPALRFASLLAVFIGLSGLALTGHAQEGADPYYAYPGGNSASLRCKSENFSYRYCRADTRGGVRLVRQRSDARCIEGQTWGYDRGGIWVNRGCDAEFQMGYLGGAGNLRCRSENFRYQYCRVDTRGGVRLVRQRSDARCIEGQTWGYDRGGIWVNRGCDAEFSVGYPTGDGSLRCRSENFRYQYCRADTRGGVRLVRQRSDARCIQGQTWGYDRGGIWVNRGCDAEFQVGYDNGNGADLRCKSENFRYQYCRADTRGGVRLVRQRSDARCIQGQTWGYDRGGVWVNRGCDAEFRLGY